MLVDSEWMPECSASRQRFPGSRQGRPGFVPERSEPIQLPESGSVQSAAIASQPASASEHSATAPRAFASTLPPGRFASPGEPALAPARFERVPERSVAVQLPPAHSYPPACPALWVKPGLWEKQEVLIAPCH